MKKSNMAWLLFLAALLFAACSNLSGGPGDDPKGDADNSPPDMGSPSDIKTPTIPTGITVAVPTADAAVELLSSSMDAISDLFSADDSANKSIVRKMESTSVDLSSLSSTGFTVTGSIKGTRDSTELDDHTTNPPKTGDAYYDYITNVAAMEAALADKDTGAGEDGHSFRICGKEMLKIDFSSKEDGTYERIAGGADPESYQLVVDKGDYSESVKLSYGIAFFVLRDDGLAAKFILSYAASSVGDGTDDGEGETSGSKSVRGARGGEVEKLPVATLKIYNPLDNALIASTEISGDDVLDTIPAIFLGDDKESESGDGSK